MGGNFKVRVTNVNGFDDMYTLGKIYEIVDGVFTSDDDYDYTNIKDFDNLCRRLSPTFELIEEEKSEWKMKCIDVGNSYWRLGEIIEVNKLTGEANSVELDGRKCSIDNKILIFEEWSNRTTIGGSKWELIEDEGENKVEDLRELIKPCYVVKFRDTKDECIAIKLDDGKINFNDIRDLSIGVCELYDYTKDLTDADGFSQFDIVEIRGYGKNNQTDIESRPLIWKREEEPVKSPTQLEIESIELEQRKLADRLAKLKAKGECINDRQHTYLY